VHCKLEDKGLVPNAFNSGGWVHSQCLTKLHRPKTPLITDPGAEIFGGKETDI
jgi:hypothetical protein